MKLRLSNRLAVSDAPEELVADLKRVLTLKNPKWEENRKMGRFNRGVPEFLKLYQTAKSGDILLPRGFVAQVIRMCRNRGIDYELIDRRRELPEVAFEFQGELKPFQAAAVEKLLRKEFGTLCAPTGAGKTVIGLYMIARRRQPALVLVHTKSLALQWVERIETFLGIPGESVGMIGDGKREVGEKVTVALVQTLYKCADEVSPKIGYLLVDECHRAPSRTFTEAVATFDSRYMLGLTATPWRRDRLTQLITWHLGDIHHQVDEAELKAGGHILNAEVIFRETAFQPFHDPVREYSKVIAELTAEPERNRLIVADIAEEVRTGDGICLVLSDRKYHCELIAGMLSREEGIDAEVLTGDTAMADRKSVTDRLNTGEIRVLIATGQLIGEGFDCKNLATLFIATPVKFYGRLIQYLGRVLRPSPGKKTARVYDYVDVLAGPLRAAAVSRQRVYQKHFNTGPLPDRLPAPP